jgi:hypothetical protein
VWQEEHDRLQRELQEKLASIRSTWATEGESLRDELRRLNSSFDLDYRHNLTSGKNSDEFRSGSLVLVFLAPLGSALGFGLVVRSFVAAVVVAVGVLVVCVIWRALAGGKPTTTGSNTYASEAQLRSRGSYLQQRLNDGRLRNQQMLEQVSREYRQRLKEWELRKPL